MKGDYTVYIALSYAAAFIVLGGVGLSSLLRWKKAGRDDA